MVLRRQEVARVGEGGTLPSHPSQGRFKPRRDSAWGWCSPCARCRTLGKDQKYAFSTGVRAQRALLSR